MTGFGGVAEARASIEATIGKGASVGWVGEEAKARRLNRNEGEYGIGRKGGAKDGKEGGG